MKHFVPTGGNPSKQRGFALIITISLMVLLSLLAVGLLGLSTISLRASSSGEAMAEARANARMAMKMAIGDLQKTLGPDRAISARASVIHGDQQGEPNLTGAWESWHWEPQPNGSPSYAEKSERFRQWLVSSPNPEDARQVDFASSSLQDPVQLTRATQDGALRGARVGVGLGERDGGGGFAWAVTDESAKISVDLAEPEDEPEDYEKIANRTAPPRFRPETVVSALDPASIDDPRKLLSLDTVDLAVGEEVLAGHRDDFTTGVLGLLTDVTEGGLRTDLTTLFETDTDVSQVSGLPTPYPFDVDSAPRWSYLKSHYDLYKRVSTTGNGESQVSLSSGRSGDLSPVRNGTNPIPQEEKLLPVIARLQIVFSIVTHHSHIPERVQFYNEEGVPQGNQNFAVPHLVYDPVVTLYNPYDVSLDMDHIRVRIWDPPVVFGFAKGVGGGRGSQEHWLRPDFSRGNYHGLARFQIANDTIPNARKFFTLLLTDQGRGGGPGGRLELQPGEVKVFSPYVENRWTWGLETSEPYSPRSFFDWQAGADFANVDPRFSGGRDNTGQFGVQCVPGWDPRAGLQTDHLSYDGARPSGTLYRFEEEHGRNDGWVAVRTTDSVSVHAKPGRTVNNATVPDFQVDLLAGQRVQPESDVLRTYSFRFENVEEELGALISGEEIERDFRIGDVLQTPGDQTAGGKSPFAMLTMEAKTTLEVDDFSMPWVHNHPVTEGAEQDTSAVGDALDTYDVRLEEIADFGNVQIQGDNKGFYGASDNAQDGVSNVPMFRVPRIPASSLGEFIPANLIAGSTLPRVTHALGNSQAHPLIPASTISRPAPGRGSGGVMLDHSYLMNDALWDRYFFSTVASFGGGGLAPSESRGVLLEDFLRGDRRLMNSRFVPLLSGDGSISDEASNLDGLSDEEFSRRIGSRMAIEGPFNINSDSRDAWVALLTSLRDRAVLGWANRELAPEDRTAFPRQSFPLAGDSEGSPDAPFAVQGQVRWAGFRALSDNEINNLAIEIVEQIRARAEEDDAPSLSLGEFVNRRLTSEGSLHSSAGLLQTAIEESGVNSEFHQLDSKSVGPNDAATPQSLTGLANPEARTGFTAEGAPPILTQGDLLMAMAPVITARGDTFRIQAYGESRDSAGTVTARARCEAVVQRIPDFVDPVDTVDTREADLASVVNENFGRRFVVKSFRWLSSDEV